MKKLEMTVKQTYYVDYGDLEEFICDVYGKEYEIVPGEEVGNDVTLTYEIKGKVQEWDLERLNRFKNGEYVNYILPSLLEDMAANGKIPTGSYAVRVSW